MKNFLRAFRFAWAYRGRLFISVACALFAAVFWGLNFTAIYPVLKILGSDKNLQQWIDSEISRSQDHIDGWHTDLDRLRKKEEELTKIPDPGHRLHMLRDNARDQAQVMSKLEPAQHEVYRFKVTKKYIDNWLPEDRFQTAQEVAEP